MLIGYARVSTKRQNADLQIEALRAAKCDVVVVEKASGRDKSRRGLAASLALCREGDTLVVWKLDRLGRDLVELVEIAKLLNRRDARLKILTGRAATIDISSSEGRALYGIFAAFAEIELSFSDERTKAGVAVSRLRKARRMSKKPKERRLRCVFNRSRQAA